MILSKKKYSSTGCYCNWAFLFVFIFIGACNGSVDKNSHVKKERTDLPYTEAEIGINCRIWSIMNPEANYILKVNLSGSCENLSFNEYLENIKPILKKRANDPLITRGGKIEYQFYNITPDEWNKTELLNVTAHILQKRVHITHFDSSSIEMEISE